MAHGVSTAAASADETLLRLAVLLQAGVSPIRAWGYAADSGDAVALRVRAALDRGESLTAAIAAAGEQPTPARSVRRAWLRRGAVRASDLVRSDPWCDIAAAWEIAAIVGAPLADSLRNLAVTLRDTQSAGDDVRVALAEPAATARLMGWLPLVAVLLGLALGFDTLGTLIGNPLGVGCLAAGALLIAVGHRWNAALVRRARGAARIPGLDAELLAIALSGGVSIDRARGLVETATASIARQAASPTASPTASPAEGTSPTEHSETEAVLALSRRAGVPAVELLRASAAMARHRARIDGRLRAARLSSRLLLPLGVCTLPAFLLLGVAPMLLSVMTAVPLTL